MSQAQRNHYVPVWYQKRFLAEGENHFNYLDLSPERTKNSGNRNIYRRNLLHWGPKRCFYQDDLYTLKLGNWNTDLIEKKFFGPIDENGQKSVKFFSEFEMRGGVHEAFNNLVAYMDAQKIRTPRGLDWLGQVANLRNANQTLIAMQTVFRRNATMWTEGVWEIVNCENCVSKFLLTDEPVALYNSKIFPGSKYCLYPKDVSLSFLGTRTIFPLDANNCLIITHREFTRNPWANQKKPRINARSFSSTIINLTEIQTGRKLDEEDVLRINLILKKKSNRYIASCSEDDLYPERNLSSSHWSNLDDDWFLFPNLYKISFLGGVAVGYDSGASWAIDEYGFEPGHPKYDDDKRRDREWNLAHKARIHWALRREGKSVARIHESRFKDSHDRIMLQDLDEFRHGRRRLSK